MSELESAAAFRDFISELSLGENPISERELTPYTLYLYKQRLRAFQAWLEDRRLPISANAAKQFLAELKEGGYAQRSIRGYYSPIKSFLAYLGIVFKKKFPNQRRLPAYRSATDIESLMAAADSRADTWAKLKERDKLIILVAVFTGFRRSELANLRPCDLAGDFIYVRAGKGDKDRVVPFAQDIQEPLLSYIQSQNISPTGSIFGVTSKHIYRIIKKYAEAAGLNMSPHALRHYFATALVERGVPISAIQQLLGHADIKTTAIYLDMVPGHLQSAVSQLSGSLSSITKTKKEAGIEDQEDSELHPLLLRSQPYRHHRSPCARKAIGAPVPNSAVHNAPNGRVPPKRRPHIASVFRSQHRDQQRPHASRPVESQKTEHNHRTVRQPAHLLSQPAGALATSSIRQNGRAPLAKNGETLRQIWRESGLP